MAGAASNPPQIDVATSSVKYETGNSTTHVMKVSIGEAMGDQLAAAVDGVDLKLNDVVATITLTATGNFTAVAAVTEGGPAGKVWLDRDADCTPAHAAVVDDDTTQDVDETMAARNDNLGLAMITPGGLEAVVTLTNAADGEDDQGDPTGGVSAYHRRFSLYGDQWRFGNSRGSLFRRTGDDSSYGLYSHRGCQLHWFNA